MFSLTQTLILKQHFPPLSSMNVKMGRKTVQKVAKKLNHSIGNLLKTKLNHSMGNRQYSNSIEVCVPCILYHITHLITIVPASQLHFLANKNPKLAGGSQ